MRWLSRREVFKHGVTATVLPVLGLGSVAPTGTPGYAVEEPSVLAALSGASWASPIYEAVLNPTDAARRATSELKANAEGQLGSPADLRRAVAIVMQASLSSEYTQLVQSLPGLIGQIELANLQARDADRLPAQRLLSDVYAIAGWTLRLRRTTLLPRGLPLSVPFSVLNKPMTFSGALPRHGVLLRCICGREVSTKPAGRLSLP
jgi:hypothetical protein